MASPRIEALKDETTVSLKRSTVDRTELLKKVEETVVIEVVRDIARKSDGLLSAYTYGSGDTRADRLEILVDACKSFIDFANEIRNGKVLKLSAGEANGEV